MLSYFGVIDDAHFRAVARSALRARGFTLAPAAAAAHAAAHRRIGAHFVEKILPPRLPSWADAADLQRLRDADRRCWQRLPLTAALGWRQAEFFLSASMVAPIEAVHAVGGAFNAIISLVDYIVDERPDGACLVDLLDEALLVEVFDLRSDVDCTLRARYYSTNDAHTRMLVALIGMFAAECRRLHHLLECRANWDALAIDVIQLFRAERSTVSPAAAGQILARPEMLAALECKSVGPSIALMRIASLGDRALASDDALLAATALGRVFWRMDDLVDLLVDCRRGAPSTLTIRLQDHVLCQGRDIIADADLYDVVDQAAGEVMHLLDQCTLHETAGSTGRANHRGRLRDFARDYVGGWTGWPEESSPVAKKRVWQGVTSAAVDAVTLLTRAQRDGFSDAAHRLSFPRSDSRYETHRARLCVRALVSDALLDARNAGLAVHEPSLHADAVLLLRAKHRLVRGGWSYIAEVPELPPDADDNAFVVQVLTRLGGHELAATADEPLRLSLDAAHQDGGIPTWIIDPRGDGAADAAVRNYFSVMGGWGVHPEVVANFGYALILFDHARYHGSVDRIASYLEAAQNDDGSWTSAWYDGPFYGTFRAATHLAFARPGSAALARAREFILACQRPDGAWGAAEGDPLSTALALLCLDRFRRTESSAFAHGLRRLLTITSQSEWRAYPWIRFPVTDGEIVYGSPEVTAAFALKAFMTVPDSFIG